MSSYQPWPFLELIIMKLATAEAQYGLTKIELNLPKANIKL